MVYTTDKTGLGVVHPIALFTFILTSWGYKLIPVRAEVCYDRSGAGLLALRVNLETPYAELCQNRHPHITVAKAGKGVGLGEWWQILGWPWIGLVRLHFFYVSHWWCLIWTETPLDCFLFFSCHPSGVTVSELTRAVTVMGRSYRGRPALRSKTREQTMRRWSRANPYWTAPNIAMTVGWFQIVNLWSVTEFFVLFLTICFFPSNKQL